MANLFWKTKKGTKALLATPFKTEEEFERTVFDTSELLEEIFLLRRQIRGGGKPGIPDILGVDSDGNICIIEMKNTTVDSSIIPQVLHYAFWAETHPDSIKSLWLECDNKPEDISISWDGFTVRIMVIAPSILKSTLDLVDKINYPVDLIEVKRWVEEDNELLLVNKLEEDKQKIKSTTAKGMPVYNEAFYKRQYNSKSAVLFIKYAKSVEALARRQGWQLETKFNKHYCGFKAGFFNAFGVKWVGTKSFAFFFKLSEAEAKKFGIPMKRYEGLWKEAIYSIEPGKTKTKDYLELFELAYKNLTGD